MCPPEPGLAGDRQEMNLEIFKQRQGFFKGV
jgi:hypothetical protein